MSDLWKYKVIRKEEKSLDLEFVSVHPDTGVFFTEKAFSLGVIAEPMDDNSPLQAHTYR